MSCSFESSSIPEACKLRCPVLKDLEQEKMSISEKADEIIQVALSDEVDQVSSSTAEGLSQNGFEIDGDRLAKILRQAGAQIVEGLDTAKSDLDAAAVEIGEICAGPIEFMAKDTLGRSVGVSVCGSSNAPDGASLEPANIYRF